MRLWPLTSVKDSFESSEAGLFISNNGNNEEVCAVLRLPDFHSAESVGGKLATLNWIANISYATVSAVVQLLVFKFSQILLAQWEYFVLPESAEKRKTWSLTTL